MKIGILGLPSTGKTTLARALAGKLHETFDSIDLIAEYAREYIARNGPTTDIWEQHLITSKQIERERETTSEAVITDSPVILGLLYARYLFNPESGNKHPLALTELFNDVIRFTHAHPYDVLVVLESEVNIVDDGIRESSHISPEWRLENMAALNYIIELTKPAKLVLRVKSTDMQDRIQEIVRAVRDLR